VQKKAVGLRQVVVQFFSFFVSSLGVFANRLSPTKNRKIIAQATLPSPSRKCKNDKFDINEKNILKIVTYKLYLQNENA
jgi:hypothetical protein